MDRTTHTDSSSTGKTASGRANSIHYIWFHLMHRQICICIWYMSMHTLFFHIGTLSKTKQLCLHTKVDIWRQILKQKCESFRCDCCKKKKCSTCTNILCQAHFFPIPIPVLCSVHMNSYPVILPFREETRDHIPMNLTKHFVNIMADNTKYKCKINAYSVVVLWQWFSVVVWIW